MRRVRNYLVLPCRFGVLPEIKLRAESRTLRGSNEPLRTSVLRGPRWRILERQHRRWYAIRRNHRRGRDRNDSRNRDARRDFEPRSLRPSNAPPESSASGRPPRARSSAAQTNRCSLRAFERKRPRRPPMSRQIGHEHAQILQRKATRQIRHDLLVRCQPVQQDDRSLTRHRRQHQQRP